MASRPNVKTRPITRDKLATFLRSAELIKAFENMTNDVSETLPDAIAGINGSQDSVLIAQLFARPPAAMPTFQDEASDILRGKVFGA